jgi:hypothetical protein
MKFKKLTPAEKTDRAWRSVNEALEKSPVTGGLLNDLTYSPPREAIIQATTYRSYYVPPQPEETGVLGPFSTMGRVKHDIARALKGSAEPLKLWDEFSNALWDLMTADHVSELAKNQMLRDLDSVANEEAWKLASGNGADLK